MKSYNFQFRIHLKDQPPSRRGILSTIKPSKHDALAQCWAGVCQRRRQWANVSPTLGQSIVFAGISSLFDPLGLVAPFLLQGKIILQELCVENKGWDDPICDEVRIKWEKWRNQLLELERLQISLCYNKPADFGKLKCVETHHFSDTCQTDHGKRSYLRLIDIED